MSDDPAESEKRNIPAEGTILRARNGDVIRYDQTGLDLVLSDRVIDDIAARLPVHPSAPEPIGDKSAVDCPPRLKGLDVWDIEKDGEWFRFHGRIPGRQGMRRYRVLDHNDPDATPPAIIAESHAPLSGILGFGGQRWALGVTQASGFPCHVMAPADEIGAVGMAGLESAQERSDLLNIQELTREAFMAEALLENCLRTYSALPVFMVRTETDSSASLGDLARGRAFDNLLVAAQNLNACANRMGTRSELLAICLDFALEDVVSDPLRYQTDMLGLLTRLGANLGALGMRMPPVLSIFDCGTPQISDLPVLRAQSDLAWMGWRHGLVYAAPGYMFEQDEFARPTAEALAAMGEMQASALQVLATGERWHCPTFLLAERDTADTVRVRADAMEALVVDENDPFDAGSSYGFRLDGDSSGAAILAVERCPDIPSDILVHFDALPRDEPLKLVYGFGAPARAMRHGYPAACGSVRDTWSRQGRNGRTLHRWALPTVLEIH